MAAVMCGKVKAGPEAKVVATVSGRNIDIEELEHAMSDRPMSHI